MTPKQYASKYLEMEVFIFSDDTKSNDGSWQTVRVGSYRLGAAWQELGGDKKKYDAGTDRYYYNDLTGAVRDNKKISTKIKRIDGVIESKEYEYDEIKYALVAPFYGKGYPEEVQLALQMRYRFQKSKFSLENFVKASFIGLDCNGFVGGFIERRSAGDKWLRSSASKTSNPIGSLLGPSSSYFTSWDDFRPPGPESLLLGLCDSTGNLKDHMPDGGVGHIVITEPNTILKHSDKGPVEFTAVESTGGIGLTSSTYKVKSIHLDKQKRAFFKVERGNNKGDEYFRFTRLMS